MSTVEISTVGTFIIDETIDDAFTLTPAMRLINLHFYSTVEIFTAKVFAVKILTVTTAKVETFTLLQCEL